MNYLENGKMRRRGGSSYFDRVIDAREEFVKNLEKQKLKEQQKLEKSTKGGWW